jgi:hypothetical protein
MPTTNYISQPQINEKTNVVVRGSRRKEQRSTYPSPYVVKYDNVPSTPPAP